MNRKYEDYLSAFEKTNILTIKNMDFLDDFYLRLSNTILENLYQNCKKGIHFFDYTINNRSSIIISLPFSLDKIDIVNGQIKKRQPTGLYREYEGGPILFDFFYNYVKTKDRRFNAEELTVNNNYIIRISI
jgi:hypothetical protein